MTWNDDKFVRMSHGKIENLHNLYLFTPNYMDPIPQEICTRDLGIMVDNDCTFKSKRTLAVKKTNQRCSWVLRTFLSRDPQIMKTLWRSFCQPI